MAIHSMLATCVVKEVLPRGFIYATQREKVLDLVLMLYWLRDRLKELIK